MVVRVRNGLGLAVGLVVALGGAAAAERWEIDPMHTSVVFRVQHLGVSFVHGRFNEFSGEVTFDPTDTAKGASAAMVVQTASVDTAVPARDEHLRTADFFDVGSHPTMRFESTGWKKGRGDSYQLTGDLTLLGVTKEIVAPVEVRGPVDGMEGEVRIGFSTKFTIKRSEFGMANSLGPIGDDVEITLELECVQAKDGAVTEDSSETPSE